MAVLAMNILCFFPGSWISRIMLGHKISENSGIQLRKLKSNKKLFSFFSLQITCKKSRTTPTCIHGQTHSNFMAKRVLNFCFRRCMLQSWNVLKTCSKENRANSGLEHTFLCSQLFQLSYFHLFLFYPEPTS